MRQHLKGFLAGLALGIAGVAAAQLLPYFGPVTGILKGQAGNPQTSVAAASDVVSLWSGCSSSEAYLGYLGSCITPSLFTSSASGIVPASGGGTANYLRADGTWANPSTSPCTFAAPSAQVGPAAITGSTGDCMDAGSAPAFNEGANYTLTGSWTFGDGLVLANTQSLFGEDSGGTAEIILQPYSDNNVYLDSPLGGGVLYFRAATSAGGTEVAGANLTAENSTYSQFNVYDAGGSAFNAGYLGLPATQQSTNYTLALKDRGKSLQVGATGLTYTVPESVFVSGDVVTIVNLNSGVTASIAAGTGVTLYWAGTESTGTRTLTGYGYAVIFFYSATAAFVSGPGVS